MTDHELQLLTVGFSTGAYFMLLVQAGFGLLDDRRDRKAARAAQAQLDAARERANGTRTNGTSTMADLPSTLPADLREFGEAHR
ncbi:hypothetical protein [Streptomyces sp. B21-083]|uniref:hypothetical protein n=1 Tax=Streptomyces sp. B21-083 TaxID=3039410 RepID=UPI002FF1AF0A